MSNSIGSFQFLSLRGSVERPSQQLDRPIARAGVDGIGLWQTGVRGRPFQLRSMVDAPGIENARMFFAAYRLLIGGDLQILVQDGHNFFVAEGFKAEVLDVRLIELKKILNAVGGAFSPSSAKLVCNWTLIAVDPTP